MKNRHVALSMVRCSTTTSYALQHRHRAVRSVSNMLHLQMGPRTITRGGERCVQELCSKPQLIHRYHHEFSCHLVEDASKDESDERTTHDDHVVWHAKVGSCQIHEKYWGIDPCSVVCCISAIGKTRNKNGWWEVPTSLGVRRMLGISEEGL